LFDSLAYGVMGLDAEGIIRVYRSEEAIPTAPPVGRSLVSDIAPCGRVDELWSVFRALCVGETNETVTFDLAVGFQDPPRRVTVRMSRARDESAAEFPDVVVWALVETRPC
jgi:hypothetical protein